MGSGQRKGVVLTGVKSQKWGFNPNWLERR